jgi:hypothetical protein
MNDYQREQRDALEQIVKKNDILASIHDDGIGSYLSFRRQLDEFSDRHFARHCTRACFETRTSACCSKDGIITFWADMVINVACSDGHQIDDLYAAIEAPMFGDKCIYLGKNGCRWQVRPLGCALFLCDRVKDDVLARRLDLRTRWEAYQTMGKTFRWPDRPVLFDHLEQVFMGAGCRSPLMYINTSPGLLRIKQQAKISCARQGI